MRRRRLAVAFGAVALGCALVATGFAASRVVQPPRAVVLEIAALAPWGLPFGVAGVAAGGVAMSLARPRRATGILTACCAALTAVHAWALAPLVMGEAPVGNPGCSLTLMVQNLEGGDGGALADTARTAGVDVLVVVEPRLRTWTQLRAGSGQLPHVVGGRDAGPDGIQVLSRYPLSAIGAAAGQRRAVRVDAGCAGTIELVAVHPRPPYLAADWAADHEALRRSLAEAGGPGPRADGARAVVAGDFNATLDHAPMRALLAAGWSDAADQANAGFLPTWPAPGTVRRAGVTLPPLNAIDHVLLGDGLVATDVDVRDNPGADHRGLLVRIRPTTGR